MVRNRKNRGVKARKKYNKLTKEATVYWHYKRQPIYSIQKVIHLNEPLNRPSYECSVDVGQKEHFSSGVIDYLDWAKRVALRKALTELEVENWPAEISTPRVTKTIIDGLSIHAWAKSMNDETIGLLFKDILSRLHQQVNVRYTTRHHREGELVGYISELYVDGEKFKSLGLMTNEDQAEQSAAEICLRTLGYLPEVASEEDLIIQPFQGGYICKDVDYKKPYISTSKLNSDFLEAFIASRSLMEAPKYYIKYPESKSTQDGKEEMANCICCVDGKVFEASPLQPESIAIQVAAEKAVNHFGLSCIHQSMEFCKHFCLVRRDFYMKERLHDRKPSENKRWLWSCFSRENTYQECDLSKTVQDVLQSPFFQSNIRSVEVCKKFITFETMQKPSFKGKLLLNHDISVADIDANNPNLVTMGNSDFSIKMWCTDGKIYSKQRKCAVEVVPGHNIHQLSCEYRVLLPSLEVYLHAVDCADLFYPNPPKPVVTSCGVVVLFHDYSANPNDIYVLLQQKIDYKPSKSMLTNVFGLKRLLYKLILPTSNNKVTPAQAMEGIDQWNEDDVKLLSKMSMESLCQVLSKYVKYDTRWNELFARQKLPEELKEIQDICLKELKRLEEEKEEKTTSSEDKVDKSQEWELPQSEFMSRFDDTGIFIEGSEFCGMRSLAEMTGMKISLGDIEKCSVIDIPVENDGKQHRGDILRYYMWNKIGKEAVPKPDDDETELLKNYTLFEKCIIRHNGIRYATQNDFVKQERVNNYLLNVQYINLDGSKVSGQAAPNKEHHVESKNDEESMDVDDVTKHEESMEDDIEWTNDGEELKDDDIEVLDETNNGDKLKDDNIEGAGEANNGEELKDDDIEVLGETNNGEELKDDDIEDAGEANNGEELKDDDLEVLDETNNSEDLKDDDIEVLDKTNNGEELKDDDIEVLDETNNGDELKDDDIKVSDKEPSENEEDEEESKEDDNQVSDSLHKKIDPCSITTDMVGKTDSVDDEYIHVDEDDIGVTTEQKHDDASVPKGRTRKRRKANQQRLWRNLKLPPRDAFTLQCEWIILDKAIEECPMLKKVAETTTFQDQLNWFVSQLGKK